MDKRSPGFDRRTFLRSLAVAGAAGMTCSPALGSPSELQPQADQERFVKKARYVTTLKERKVRCDLCPRSCEVADRERGYCGVRENRGGTYYTLVWGRLCALNVDPIEKKPFFHFLPGTTALSVATAGCNMECLFCQNWEISQFRPEQVPAYFVSPERLAELAASRRIPSIAYTYNEPVIFYEYMYDSAVAGNQRGVRSVMVSNGYIHQKPMEALCEVLAAVKIDLKAFTESFYKKYTKGELKPVLETLKLLARRKKWFEVVVLLIPTLNDGRKELEELCKWLAGELGPEVPVHFTRYHPTYKLQNLPPTPLRSLERAHEIGRKAGLAFVYIGNVPGHSAESTYCPSCGKPLIQRYGYRILSNNIKDGKCAFCGRVIPGVWS